MCAGGGLDLLALMRLASRRGRLGLCLPWVGCLLQMLQDAPISRQLPIYRQPVVALRPNAAVPPKPRNPPAEA